MKVGKWFRKRKEPVIYNNDVLVDDEWYQYYRECARKLRLILRIIDQYGIVKDESTMNTIIGEAHRDMRKLADILDPEETKEWFTYRKKETLTSKPQNRKKKSWNKRRRELYGWMKRAKAVNINPLPSSRPFLGQRIEWEESVIRAERLSKTKNGKYNPGDGAYKRECIDKLKSLQVNDFILVEGRVYQTVDEWTRSYKLKENDFEGKRFNVEKINHNTQRIWRAK